MDRILMRHDDVNTFGVVLYTDLFSGSEPRLYKDAEFTQPVSVEEGKTLLFKVQYIFYRTLDGGLTRAYGKPVAVNIGEFEHEVAFEVILKGSSMTSIETRFAKVFDGEPEANIPN